MRIRLILSFSLIVVVAIGVVILIASQQTADEVRTFMFRGGLTDSDELVAQLEDYYQNQGSWQGVDSLLHGPGSGRQQGGQGSRQGFGPGSSNSGLLLADADGYQIADSKGSTYGELLSQEELSLAIPLRVDGGTIGYLIPEGNLVFSEANENNLISRLDSAARTAALVAGVVALGLALLLSQNLIRPIRNLTQAATRIADGDLSHRVPIQGGGELAVLGRTFNDMAASLESARESRRTMTADIAHELRTPLSVQRAHLEALQDGIYDLESGNLDPIVEQNYLLNRLVEDLRLLALADAGQLDLLRTMVDLPALIEGVLIRFEPQAASQQVRINFSQDGLIPPISLDSQRIEQVLNNLLSNALRFSPPEGQVNLRLHATLQDIFLEVHDGGSGIPDDALPHIFERFYRSDNSRSRADGGTGLGLSIARKLTQAHDGDLTAANHPGGGAVFTLRLPVVLENQGIDPKSKES
jgi:two-component system OmpR family sensor kinase/two-component system sensor histidine kinase BaeS